jgi:hypothetical protein
MLEADAGGVTVEVESSSQQFVSFCYRATDTSSRDVTEFLRAEKIALTGIHRRWLNICGNQTVDESTVRQ